MNYSEFQLQHPLSSKKFAKKMIEKSILFLFLSFVIAISIPAFRFLMATGVNNFTFNLPLAIIGFIVVFAILYCVYAWYVKAYIKNYFYNCDNSFITIKKGVFTPTEIHVLYQKIQDVYVDQDLLDRIMGLYDVHISSATVTSGIEAHIDGVDAETAEKIKKILLDYVQGGSQKINETKSADVEIKQEVTASKILDGQKISSKEYPISSRFTVQAVLSMLGSTIFFFVIAVFYFVADAKDGSKIASSGFVIFLAVLAVLYFLYRLITFLVWKKNYYFEFTNDYILLKTSIFSASEKHLPYKSIQNVTVEQSFVARLLGLYSVSIENASGAVSGSGKNAVASNDSIDIVGLTKEHADKLKEVLNKVTSSINPSSMGL